LKTNIHWPTFFIAVILTATLSGLLGYAWMKEHSIDKEVALVRKTIAPAVTQAIMDIIKKECFGTYVLSIEFMGEESFSLICKVDKKLSKRRKK